jgi:hypothetical protein
VTAAETAGWLLLWYVLGAAGAYALTYVARPGLRLAWRRATPQVVDWVIRLWAVTSGALVGHLGYGGVEGVVVGALGGATSAWAVSRFREAVQAWSRRTFGGQADREE